VDSKIISALKEKNYFHRLIFPPEIRGALLEEMRKEKWA
jgi:hypothetical protein